MYHQPTDLIQAANNTTERRLNIYDGPSEKLKSILVGFLNAIYESRRIKAQRVIHQYRDLIAQLNAGSSVATTATGNAD
jgi:hypothetical protein